MLKIWKKLIQWHSWQQLMKSRTGEFTQIRLSDLIIKLVIFFVTFLIKVKNCTKDRKMKLLLEV